jgi:hypothetical protein
MIRNSKHISASNEPTSIDAVNNVCFGDGKEQMHLVLQKQRCSMGLRCSCPPEVEQVQLRYVLQALRQHCHPIVAEIVVSDSHHILSGAVFPRSAWLLDKPIQFFPCPPQY